MGCLASVSGERGRKLSPAHGRSSHTVTTLSVDGVRYLAANLAATTEGRQQRFYDQRSMSRGQVHTGRGFRLTLT